MTQQNQVSGDALLERLFRHGDLRVSSRPLVDLDSGQALAVRVLTHGSRDLPGQDVDDVRRLVASSEDPGSLDATARARALVHTAADPLARAVPQVLDAVLPGLSQLDPHGPGPATVLLLDATQILDRPAEMLRLVGSARSQGWQVGLREVGADPSTLGAVAVVEPALMVLAGSVLQDPTSELATETIQATTAYCHDGGAVLVAEDVDDAEAAAAAVAAGATLVAGRHDRPPHEVVPAGAEALLGSFRAPLPVPHQSPFDLAARQHLPRRAGRETLLALTLQLERTATTAGRSTMVLSAFQDAQNLDRATVERYSDLGRRCSLVLAVARGMSAVGPVPHVVTTDLHASDPLVQEWTVIVLAPTSQALLATRERPGSGSHRSFDYVLAFDRDLVAHAARSVLTRVTQVAEHERGAARGWDG
ncbi:DICT sensory domain-containing protein [Auraticoccus monumenti]|uniref:EAL domain, c-di-GMP-specific phosphodiesterase class I (Or its enzymatically inactive variant) n=1 Tax=Auraticoccus monumenti TaxID=675864 RepID=A0A1G6YPT2_9ACTN|nr:DICT sensory domain-containing protein [Auraticoccus monumenti]SDD92320.1 EAL domain, c-di-GMP-specific phosphodiesterase class I (or its enzymatically inactive variant) [Auraticoccus monumenti]